MAHFAKIEDNKVTQVIVINNNNVNNLDFPDSESVGQEYISKIGLDGEWKQTSYNNNFRHCYAGIGFIYNEKLDIFHPNFPYPSWTFDEVKIDWIPPIPYPQDGKDYEWNESEQKWILESTYMLNPKP